MNHAQFVLEWLRENDLPNWLALLYNILVASCVFVASWIIKLKRVRAVPGLEVCIELGKGRIDQIEAERILFRFINRTGSTVYIRSACINHNTSRVVLHSHTWKDAATGRCELKFRNAGGNVFEHREIIVYANGEVETSIYLERSVAKQIIHFNSGLFRRVFSSPKYFILYYVAVVGDRKCNVKTVV